MKIILISGKAGHGKDTVGDYLTEKLDAQGKKVLVCHFGDAVKHVCTKFFGWDGRKTPEGRKLTQHVATDTTRAKYPNFWADFIVKLLDVFYDEWDVVLIPDLRFTNEVTLMQNWFPDVTTLRVNRPGFVREEFNEDTLKHVSENQLDDYNFDYVIDNNSTLDDLYKKVDSFIEAVSFDA